MLCAGNYRRTFLVEHALAERHKNRDGFYCMQMSLVMSMRFIFGDDWNNAKCLSRFSAMQNFFFHARNHT